MNRSLLHPSGLPATAPSEWLVLSSGPGRPAWNMALDEALLEDAGRWGRPLLRFYGWVEAAATFGYSQRWVEVEALTSLRPLIRRPTGGGLVSHEADWTYSLVVPVGHNWYRLRARESYTRVHAWVRDAFTHAGLCTELSPGRRPELPGQCFVGAERDDVVWQGRKIAGAAQRRCRTGLLIQGSIQPPPGSPERSRFEAALREVASVQWGIRWRAAETVAGVMERAAELEHSKYGQESHNRRR